MRNVDSVTKYLNEIGETPLLSRDRELELARNYDKHGCEESKKILIQSNLRLVVASAKKYNKCGVPIGDLIQEGNIGLITGIEKFDPERGFKLSTYVTWWIRQSIHRCIANQSRTVRLPVHVTEDIKKLNQIMSRYHSLYERNPTIEEMVKESGTKEKKVRKLLISDKSIKSLDDEIPGGGEDKNTFANTVVDERSTKEMNSVESTEFSEELAEGIEDMPEECKIVIKCRFGVGRDGEIKTLKKTSEILGVSREQVRKIEKKAVSMLRKHLKAKEMIS